MFILKRSGDLTQKVRQNIEIKRMAIVGNNMYQNGLVLNSSALLDYSFVIHSKIT